MNQLAICGNNSYLLFIWLGKEWKIWATFFSCRDVSVHEVNGSYGDILYLFCPCLLPGLTEGWFLTRRYKQLLTWRAVLIVLTTCDSWRVPFQAYTYGCTRGERSLFGFSAESCATEWACHRYDSAHYQLRLWGYGSFSLLFTAFWVSSTAGLFLECFILVRNCGTATVGCIMDSHTW